MILWRMGAINMYIECHYRRGNAVAHVQQFQFPDAAVVWKHSPPPNFPYGCSTYLEHCVEVLSIFSLAQNCNCFLVIYFHANLISIIFPSLHQLHWLLLSIFGLFPNANLQIKWENSPDTCMISPATLFTQLFEISQNQIHFSSSFILISCHAETWEKEKCFIRCSCVLLNYPKDTPMKSQSAYSKNILPI